MFTTKGINVYCEDLRKEVLTYGGDCQLGVFAAYLYLIGIEEYNISEILVISESFGYYVENLKVAGREFYKVNGKQMRFEKKFCDACRIDSKYDNYESLNDLKNDFQITNQPVICYVDRFYLDFLNIEPVHCGNHSIIIVDIDDINNSASIIDGLDLRIHNVSLSVLEKAMYSKIIYGRSDGEYFKILKDRGFKRIADIEIIEHFYANMKVILQEDIPSKICKKISVVYKSDNLLKADSEFFSQMLKINMKAAYMYEPTRTFYRKLISEFLFKYESKLKIKDDWENVCLNWNNTLKKYDSIDKGVINNVILALQYEMEVIREIVNNEMSCF